MSVEPVPEVMLLAGHAAQVPVALLLYVFTAHAVRPGASGGGAKHK